MTELIKLTASESLRSIRAGKFTSEELVRSHIEHISSRDADVRAWSYFDPEVAIAEARAVDRQGCSRPLAGIPIGVKDVIDVVGMPTTCNSPIYQNYHPFADAACVALAKRAGAVILGKTVTTEFASRTPGVTRNPLNLAHTPGGSSSGSAAAVADFMVPLAFGTQTGGSTIRPGAYCGIVAYKPSFGTINCSGLKHLAESLDTIGVFARTVEDCALLTHAVSSRPLPDLASPPLREPRIGLCRTSRWSEAGQDTQSLLEAIASTLAKCGATVKDVVLPDDFDRLYDEQVTIMNYEAARALAWEYASHPDQLSPFMRDVVAKNLETPREVYDQAMHHAQVCRLRFSELMENYDVLLTPSAPAEAPIGLENTGNALFNKNWTLLGVPCVTFPAGLGPTGLPLGIQFIGAYGADERVLICAEWAAQQIAAR